MTPGIRLRRTITASAIGLLLAASPRLFAAGSTFLSMSSDTYDPVGWGVTYLLTPQDGTFSAKGSAAEGVTVFFDAPIPWRLTFAPPAGALLAPGVYESATLYPGQGAQPGLGVTAATRACTSITGRFVVLEAQFGPDSEILSFAADFEQHCWGWGAALLGSIRYNSSIGVGPRVSVANASAYEGDGKPRNLTFLVSLSARAPVSTSVDYATADGSARAGTDYVATSGTVTFAAGQTVATVDVPILGNKTIEPDRALSLSLSNPAGAPIAFGLATGTILDDDSGETFIEFASDAGDYIGGGKTFTLTPKDGAITPSRSGNGVTVHVDDSWDLQFVPPPAAGQLAPGIYESAGPWLSQGLINVSGEGRGCASSGRFLVLEARYAPTGDIRALAIDFEQHCDNGTAALFGSVRFNSLVDTGPRLSVASAATFEGDGEPVSQTFRMSLSKRVASGVSAAYATADATAKAGTDYVATSGTVTFAAGQTSANVDVPVLGNKVPQPDRGFVFSLGNAVGAPIGFGQAAGTILDDDAIRSLIRVDSEAGDWVGAGKHITIRPPLDGVISTIGGPADLQVDFKGATWWSFHFAPPAGGRLAVGAYEGAAFWPGGPPSAPGLSAAGEGRGCDTITGRFDVLQADFGPFGTVQALAIDLEQHCDGSTPALFASIRINSTVPVHKRAAPPTLAIAFGAADVPLNGSTPLTFLVANPNPQDPLTGIAVTDTLPPGVVVSTPSVLSGACGDGAITAPPGSNAIALSGGTLFGGGSCTFSVNVTGTAPGFKIDTAAVTSLEGGAGNTPSANLRVGLPPPFLYFASDAGDSVGLGQTFTLTSADGSITGSGWPNGVFVMFTGASSQWNLGFAPPAGVPLAPGVYESATRRGFQAPIEPGLSVDTIGRGCNTLTGRFEVLELQLGPAGELQVLALDYEQHCNGAVPALFGSIRYNSLLGIGPRVSVSPAVTYEGDGEPKNLTFWISLSARALSAVSVDYTTNDDSAKAGTDYVPKSGTALFAPGQTAGVRVDVPVLGNTVPQPDRRLRLDLGNAIGAALGDSEAFGTILDDDTGRTFIELASDAGDTAGGGQSFTLTPLDGRIAAGSGPGTVSVSFQGSSSWYLTFSAPSGAALVPGVYEGAVGPYQSAPHPSLSVGGGVCDTATGRFVVLEADIGAAGDVRKLAIDFEQHCNGAVPALLGSVRYNSLLSTQPRLSVAQAAAYEGNGEPENLPFQVSLSRRSPTAVSVDYSTADDSAKAGTDYVATAGTASFAPGQTTASVAVPILGNRIPQPDRSLGFSLSNAAGAPVAFGQAAGVILDDDSARTLLYLDSDPGDPVGMGRKTTLTTLDGTFVIGGYPWTGVYVQFRSATTFWLNFSAPSEGLLPGIYEGAAKYPSSSPPVPGLDVSTRAENCNSTSGRFIVLEIQFNESLGVQALAIDFEQHCNGATPALFGYLRYNSSVPVVPRAAGAKLFTLRPCRVVDTRLSSSPLQPGSERSFATAGICGIPATAATLVANVTVTGAKQPGVITTYRADGARPPTNTITFSQGQTRANNAFIAVSTDGSASIKAFSDSTGTVDFILDVSGYFQ